MPMLNQSGLIVVIQIDLHGRELKHDAENFLSILQPLTTHIFL